MSGDDKMRKLASIQKVLHIEPVVNSDNLEVLTVLGWKVVARRNEFQVGDLVIYFEIDSILPELPQFEFLAKTKYRLKTQRLRGQLSQGLCWNVGILPSGVEIKEGLDVTELLGVTKYEEEIPEEMVGVSRGFHPKIVSKTGEVRVQSQPELLKEFMGKRVAFTQKIEGYSSSYINDNGNIHVCSHTHSLIEDTKSVYWQMAHKYNLIDTLKAIGNFSIQGEIAGPGIIGNPLGLQEVELFVFRVFDNDKQQYLGIEELREFCSKHNLQPVPLTYENVEFNFNTEELLEMAKGFYSPSGHPQEGVVIVPMKPTYSEVLCGNLSMKVINNDYLLGNKKK